MIGQEILRNDLLKMKDSFPVFSIFAGHRGSGRKTIARWISSQVGVVVESGISVADVRSIIENCYKVVCRTVYIIPDADTMSPEAKSALLKVTEEPPHNSRFIMTLQNVSSMPPTIISRANVFYMMPYTKAEIHKYIAENYNVEKEIAHRAYCVCLTPGEVDIFMKAPDIYDYVEMVIDNIAEVSTANALKIGDKIAFKNEPDKYDLELFWRLFSNLCLTKVDAKVITEEMLIMAAGASITTRYLSHLSIRGISKQMSFINWVLEMREEWS